MANRCPSLWGSLFRRVWLLHILMLGQVVVIVLVSIILAGCSSHSPMTNIYILGLSYTNSTPPNLNSITKTLSETLNATKGSSHLEVRTGYFGMCVRQRGVLWFCSSDADRLAQQIRPENDPLNLIATASKFKSDVLSSGLLFMAIVLAFFSMALLATIPSWHMEGDEHTGSDVDFVVFPSREVSQVATTLAFVAAVLLLIAGLWQHIGAVGAAAMADTANYGNIRTDIGTGAMAMVWIGFTFEVFVTSGLIVLLVSFIPLHRLRDD